GKGPQGQRDLGLQRQRRVTTREDEAQPIILDAAVVATVGFVRGREHGCLLKLGGPRGSAAHAIDGAVARRRREPRPWVARDAVAWPPFDGRREGVLRTFLGQVPVPGDPDEGGDNPSPLVPEGIGDGGLDGRYISQIGLTSML